MSLIEQTCCFTGHRIISNEKKKAIFNKTREVVVSLIEKGVRFFGVGGAIGYDTIAAHVILSLKDKYPFIKLIVVCPCKNQDLKWNEVDKRVYRDILNSADKVVVLADTYYDGCMQARNKHLVDNSKYCVCYLEHMRGGTYNTVKYAQRQKIDIKYIGESLYYYFV